MLHDDIIEVLFFNYEVFSDHIIPGQLSIFNREYFELNQGLVNSTLVVIPAEKYLAFGWFFYIRNNHTYPREKWYCFNTPKKKDLRFSFLDCQSSKYVFKTVLKTFKTLSISPVADMLTLMDIFYQFENCIMIISSPSACYLGRANKV